MTNLDAIKLNIQINADMINHLSSAMLEAQQDELDELMLLVKLRRLATAEYALDKIKMYDNQIRHKCNSILGA